jgi:hypothetical protein
MDHSCCTKEKEINNYKANCYIAKELQKPTHGLRAASDTLRTMDVDEFITTLAYRGRLAARTLSMASHEVRRETLLSIADDIERRSVEIVAANAEDIKRARLDGMSQQLQDRLLLTESPK